MNDSERQMRRLQRHCADAFEVLFQAARSVGTQVDHVGDATVFRWRQLPIPLFNRTIGLGDDREPHSSDIDRILELYEENGTEAVIQLSPLAQAHLPGDRLRNRGLEPQGSMATFALTPGQWRDPDSTQTSSGITIEALDTHNADEFAGILTKAFGLGSDSEGFVRSTMTNPAVQSFLARYEGEAAGVGQVVSVAGVAGLYSGGVLEPFRGRGIQSALIRHRVRAALDQGYDLLYSGTEGVDNQSSRNLKRHGFFLAYELENWHYPTQPT